MTTLNTGDKATISDYGDKTPCTIIGIARNGKQITVREDRAVNCDPNAAMNGYSKRFMIVDDPNGKVRTFSVRKDGRIVEAGGHAWHSPELKTTTHTAYQDWMR
jgi:hypothetical protein